MSAAGSATSSAMGFARLALKGGGILSWLGLLSVAMVTCRPTGCTGSAGKWGLLAEGQYGPTLFRNRPDSFLFFRRKPSRSSAAAGDEGSAYRRHGTPLVLSLRRSDLSIDADGSVDGLSFVYANADCRAENGGGAKFYARVNGCEK